MINTAMDYLIRHEQQADQRAVEELTRQAFWNLYVPGCNEHYLVHKMRRHPDFVPELDFVMEKDGRIIGNIMYTRAWLENAAGDRKQILTFGPVSILPIWQRKGYGRKLIEHSFFSAGELGFGAIVIFGNPANYVGLGFKSSHKYGVSLPGGIYPSALLAKELTEDALIGGPWVYSESAAYAIDSDEAEAFDQDFAPREKGWQAGQEEFYILSQSRIISHTG